MHPAHRFAVGRVLQVDPGAHHVLQFAAQRLDAGRNLVEDVGGLYRSVAAADQLALAMGGGGARHQDAITQAHRARVAGNRLPGAAAVNCPALVVARHRLTRPQWRHCIQVVAEVARGGQERRVAVFVTAVTAEAAGHGKGLIEHGMVVRVELKLEWPQVVGPVLGLAQPRTHNHGGHRCLLQHPAGGHIGD